MSIISSSGSSYQPTAPGPPPIQQGNYGELQLLASTGPNGFVLQNATPIILNPATPNDGLLHRVLILGLIIVTVTQVGGIVQMNPSSLGTFSGTLYPGGLTPVNGRSAMLGGVVPGGVTLNLQQASAQTSGAAVLYAEIWGS